MLGVTEIYPCVQGEGSKAGTPMWLLRLYGCGVGCPWCDTPQAGKAIWMREEDILNKLLYDFASPLKWVMVTGGEPCDQDCVPLTRDLHALSYLTALETSGTSPITGEWDWITVSPKINMPGGKCILASSIAQANEIKMPVASIADVKILESEIIPMVSPGTIISLQPVSCDPAATQLCYETCISKGYSLSLQLHKWIGVK